jgi:hypothetical protein
LLTLRTTSTDPDRTISDTPRDNSSTFPRGQSINLRLRQFHPRRTREGKLLRALKSKENDLISMDKTIMYYIIKQESLYFGLLSHTLHFEFVHYYFRLLLFIFLFITFLLCWGILFFVVNFFNANYSS